MEERKEGDELDPLIRSHRRNREELKRGKKQNYIEYAVNQLQIIAYLAVLILLTFQALVLVNCVRRDTIPLWALFLVLWLGHGWLFVITVISISNIFKSMNKSNSMRPPITGHDTRTAQQWHHANEKLIPLIQYTMYNHACILSVSFTLLICEILVYLSIHRVVPAYSFLLPIYVVAGFSLSNAFICKSSSYSSSVSWFLLLTTAILLNVKILLPTALSYSVVLIPSFVLIGVWLIISVYVLLYHILKVHRYKEDQLRIVGLFTCSLLLLLVSVISLDVYLMSAESDPRSNDFKISTSCLFICCTILFSAWLVLRVGSGIATALKRMGAETPKLLSKSEDGGWMADRKYNTMVGIKFIIGDLEDMTADDFDDQILRPGEARECGVIFTEILLYCIVGSKSDDSSTSIRGDFSSSSMDFSQIYDLSNTLTTDIKNPLISRENEDI